MLGDLSPRRLIWAPLSFIDNIYELYQDLPKKSVFRSMIDNREKIRRVIRENIITSQL